MQIENFLMPYIAISFVTLLMNINAWHTQH